MNAAPDGFLDLRGRFSFAKWAETGAFCGLCFSGMRFGGLRFGRLRFGRLRFLKAWFLDCCALLLCRNTTRKFLCANFNSCVPDV